MSFRILITASTFPRFGGDVEPRFIYDFARLLIKIKGYDVTVLVPNDTESDEEEWMAGVRVKRYNYMPVKRWQTLASPGAILSRVKEKPIRIIQVPFLMLSLYLAIRREMREERYDLVHAHWIVPQGFIQSCFSGRKAPPFILTGHGTDVLGLNSELFRWMKRRALNKANGVTVVSSALSEAIGDIFDCGEKSVEVMPMGCDLRRFNPELRDHKLYKRIGISGTVILFVGRITEQKGIEYLIRAMDNEAIRSTDSNLVIIGDGDQKEELLSLIRRLHLDEKVTVLDPIDHNRLGSYYASADIFCGPTLAEGFGLAFIEASASGLPIVATTVDGVKEAVIDNKTGFLVEPQKPESLARALRRLIDSGVLRTKMGRIGRRHAELFSWENVVNGYSRLYEQVILKSGGDEHN